MDEGASEGASEGVCAKRGRVRVRELGRVRERELGRVRERERGVCVCASLVVGADAGFWARKSPRRSGGLSVGG